MACTSSVHSAPLVILLFHLLKVKVKVVWQISIPASIKMLNISNSVVHL